MHFTILAGDFSCLHTGFLENDFGLTQIVKQATHGDNRPTGQGVC